MNGDRDPRLAFPLRLRTLWRGEVPLGLVFWWHAMVVGTLLNLAATLIFAILQSIDLPDALGLVVFLLPIPYNVFVAVAVWRSAGRYAGPPPFAPPGLRRRHPVGDRRLRALSGHSGTLTPVGGARPRPS